MNVYFLPVDFTAETAEKVYGIIDKERRAHADALRKTEDRYRSLGAGLLLCYIRRLHGISSPLTVAPQGKPAFENGPAFSISHSGDCVMLVVGNGNVGADIERIEKRPCLSLAKRFFAPDEAQTVAESQTPAEAFFALWTKKEAVIKADGGGFQSSMKSFSVANGNYTSLNGRLYTVDAIESPDGYCAALAYDGRKERHTVNCLTVTDILNALTKGE